jgi:hypothetical protein
MAGHITATYVYGHATVNVARYHNTKVGCSKRPKVMVHYPCQFGPACPLFIISDQWAPWTAIIVGVAGLQHQAAKAKTIALFQVLFCPLVGHYLSLYIAQVHMDLQICILLCLPLIPVR